MSPVIPRLDIVALALPYLLRYNLSYMRKYLKNSPLWIKFALVGGILGLIVTLMNSGDPSFLHLNLIAVTFGATVWTIL